ncbi:MAG TPA: Gfo/Idh/MocA family oxidoreductase [Solirubrobacteraceae bacterium]
MSAPLGVGIVGAGLIFEEHARALAALADRARIVAVADLDEERLASAASQHAIPFACRDHRELLARPDVDVVAVCTPPCFHEQAVVDALRSGRHVLCEKPLAHTLEAADRIVGAARAHPGRLSVVHQFRYLPEVRRTIGLRDEGRLGALLFGRFHRLTRFRHPKRVRRAWWGAWEVAGGGVVMTQLIHELDLACHIFGAPAEVSAVIDTLNEPIESEDTCAATVRFASGAIVTLYGTMCAHKSVDGFDVIGTRASVHSPWACESLDREWRADAREAAQAICERDEREPGVSDHIAYLREVFDAIEAGRALPVGPGAGRRALELATAIYASALSGAPVALPLDASSPYYRGITGDDYEARPRGLPGAWQEVAAWR